MSDVERIPSMRKPARQGVPKRKPREMAKPAQGGRTREAPPVEPRAAVDPVVEPILSTGPTLPKQPTLPMEPTLPIEPTPPLEPEVQPEPELEIQPPPKPEPAPALAPKPTRVVTAMPEPAAVETVPSAPEPVAAQVGAAPLTTRLMLARVDVAWYAFRAAAFRFPAEHMDDHLTEDGWTRKQMLAHIAAWHDLTADRLVKLVLTGKPAPLSRDIDAINAAAARVAIGKTAGEVLKDVEATFNRLHRQVQRLSDAQLRLADDWAAHVIAGNTYEHWAEHIGELTPPEPPPGSGARR